MTGRRSARVAAKAGSDTSTSAATSQTAGSKRKAESEAVPKSKRGKPLSSKTQTKIEDSLSAGQDAEAGTLNDRSESKDEQNPDQSSRNKVADEHSSAKEESKLQSNGDHDQAPEDGKKTVNGFDEIMTADKTEPANTTPEGTGTKVEAKDTAVKVNEERESALPSSILEKGIIYFFFRGRVGVENPSGVDEIARSYIVLRPLPQGAALGHGPIGDSDSTRLLALPKKVLPVSPKDRFMTFVEKGKTTIDNIKEQLSSSDYSTKTVSVRHSPSADPIGEGVYAITQTGRETHLAYIITIPEHLDDVQRDVGLRQRGSYITSAKNPESAAPANASLPQGAAYPREILDEFGGRGWMPLKPRLLDYDNTQFLLIGHGDGALEKAAKAQNDEEKEENKETPLHEIEKLEEEDENRVKGLGMEDAVFTDLGLSSKEYSKVRTAW